jgi:hypothetical protein
LIKLLIPVFIFIFSTTGLNGQYYSSAAGLRLIWGIGGTLKLFIDDESAFEGILHYRSFSENNLTWNYIRLTGLYEVHNSLEEVFDGLRWYYGFGCFLSFWGGDYIDQIKGDKTYFGVATAIGLDFAFFDLPVNLSLDWTPNITLVGGGGFRGEAGGLALRYIF